jgi:NAD(P)H-nitrite reductase large subunit
MKHVIVGTGIAGTVAAESIRRLDPDGSITVIGDEAFLPYCRPMISMLLEGSIPPDRMAIREADDFRSLDIDLLTGERVSLIHTAEKSLETNAGKIIPFDRLLIATGANPLDIKADRSDLGNIFSMRNRRDVEAMLEVLPNVHSALVIGGGLVGLKAAHALIGRGVSVAVVEKLSHPLPLVTDRKSGGVIARRLEAIGIALKMGMTVTAFEGDGRVREALLDDGSRVSCDLVVVAVGSCPAVPLIKEGRIRVGQGILVDDFLETDEKGFYAAGDVAEAMDVVFGLRKVNAIWPVAAEQGVVVGMNMAGRKVPYRGGMGRNVVRMGGLDMLSGGLVNPPLEGPYEILEDEDRRRKTYRKLVFEGDVLKGLVMLNRIEKGGVLLSLMKRQMPITLPKESLFDPRFDFSMLLPGMQPPAAA